MQSHQVHHVLIFAIAGTDYVNHCVVVTVHYNQAPFSFLPPDHAGHGYWQQLQSCDCLFLECTISQVLQPLVLPDCTAAWAPAASVQKWWVTNSIADDGIIDTPFHTSRKRSHHVISDLVAPRSGIWGDPFWCTPAVQVDDAGKSCLFLPLCRHATACPLTTPTLFSCSEVWSSTPCEREGEREGGETERKEGREGGREGGREWTRETDKQIERDHYQLAWNYKQGKEISIIPLG